MKKKEKSSKRVSKDKSKKNRDNNNSWLTKERRYLMRKNKIVFK